jgi:hypothetical protein
MSRLFHIVVISALFGMPVFAHASDNTAEDQCTGPLKTYFTAGGAPGDTIKSAVSRCIEVAGEGQAHYCSTSVSAHHYSTHCTGGLGYAGENVEEVIATCQKFNLHLATCIFDFQCE